ncbi:G-TYPE LECTIN S-RECEPTOR-LIKE SERINE/THREONINE-PROTEIN KINASE LECRK4 ISOFORM X1, partial [Salix koriyanagi]
MGREFPVGDYFYRATLDSDGLFTLYGHPRAQINGRWGQTWFAIWSVPDDICADSNGDLGLGPCGYNSYCSLGTNRRPLCECLPGFSLSDTNNKFGGCQQNSLPNCRQGKSKPEDLYAIQEVPNTFWPTSTNYEKLPFTYKDLKEATDGFREQLGRGSFGTVYKGLLTSQSSRNYVAVKKLERMVQEGEKEFKTEASAIAKTHHKNLVRLLGFCDEGTNRLLVYEFMSNGTLASFLFGISKPDWNKRIQMASGIARA